MKAASVPVEITVNFAGDGVVVRPEDFLLLAFSVPLSAEEAKRVRDLLAEVAPDVRIAIVDKVAGVGVKRAPDNVITFNHKLTEEELARIKTDFIEKARTGKAEWLP